MSEDIFSEMLGLNSSLTDPITTSHSEAQIAQTAAEIAPDIQERCSITPDEMRSFPRLFTGAFGNAVLEASVKEELHISDSITVILDAGHPRCILSEDTEKEICESLEQNPSSRFDTTDLIDKIQNQSIPILTTAQYSVVQPKAEKAAEIYLHRLTSSTHEAFSESSTASPNPLEMPSLSAFTRTVTARAAPITTALSPETRMTTSPEERLRQARLDYKAARSEITRTLNFIQTEHPDLAEKLRKENLPRAPSVDPSEPFSGEIVLDNDDVTLIKTLNNELKKTIKTSDLLATESINNSSLSEEIKRDAIAAEAHHIEDEIDRLNKATKELKQYGQFLVDFAAKYGIDLTNELLNQKTKAQKKLSAILDEPSPKTTVLPIEKKSYSTTDQVKKMLIEQGCRLQQLRAFAQEQRQKQKEYFDESDRYLSAIQHTIKAKEKVAIFEKKETLKKEAINFSVNQEEINKEKFNHTLKKKNERLGKEQIYTILFGSA